jgi:NADH:ubiquinone reductase (non-electrogenic)
VARLYRRQQEQVKVTLIESQRILSSFDDRLQKYAEKQISQRKRFTLLRNSVIGMFILCVVVLCKT